MSLAALVLIYFLSQSLGSPQPSPEAEADPYHIAISKTVHIWDHFEGIYSHIYNTVLVDRYIYHFLIN